MKWYYCGKCDEVFPEYEIGSRPESWRGEAWGAPFIQTDWYDSCAECGSDDISEVSECLCGEMGLKPGEIVCKKTLDDIAYIVGELRKLFPDIKNMDKSTVLEVIADSW
jgi:hypothetical protein